MSVFDETRTEAAIWRRTQHEEGLEQIETNCMKATEKFQKAERAVRDASPAKGNLICSRYELMEDGQPVMTDPEGE